MCVNSRRSAAKLNFRTLKEFDLFDRSNGVGRCCFTVYTVNCTGLHTVCGVYTVKCTACRVTGSVARAGAVPVHAKVFCISTQFHALSSTVFGRFPDTSTVQIGSKHSDGSNRFQTGSTETLNLEPEVGWTRWTSNCLEYKCELRIVRLKFRTSLRSRN